MTSIVILGNIHFLPEDIVNFTSTFSKVSSHEIINDTQRDLAQKSKEAEVVLVGPGVKLANEFFDNSSKLKYVGVCGTSTRNIDLNAASAHGVKVTNVKDYGDEPTAEFIFMQLTSLLRGVHGLQWKASPHELMGKKIGIVGLGALGRSIADLAVAYKMQPYYCSHNRKSDYENKGLVYLELSQLLQTCEIVIVCTPTNLEILDSEAFGYIKDGAILVQASMGTVFSRPAFLDWIAGDENFAIFDYAAGEENFIAYHALPGVIFPKIIAGHSSETKHRLAAIATDNLKAYFDGSPQNLVN